jgi:uncharacterized protein YbbC (DUF1343 family)
LERYFRFVFYAKVVALVAIVELCAGAQTPLFSQPIDKQRVIVGAEQLNKYLPLLSGKKVGLIVNQTSMVGSRHLVDTLKSCGISIDRIFAPEHGYRGEADAGERIVDGFDVATGAQVISLYGKNKKPSRQHLAGLDVVVFDIQDVGARFYTYISTLFYAMEACAEQDVTFLVLDRPNPNGRLLDGPVLDMRFSSFVGIAPLPIAHGCTVAELALMYKGERWIKHSDSLDLQVIACENYHHQSPYPLPVKPSPNLPTYRSVLLYPSLCLFEGSSCSVGRGTDWPFEVVGHPQSIDTFQFIPRPNAGNKFPVHSRWVCKGLDFRSVSIEELEKSNTLNINWIIEFYRAFPNKPAFFRQDKFMDLLAGTDRFRMQIMEGCSESEIRASWAKDLEAFKALRQPYLLYN